MTDFEYFDDKALLDRLTNGVVRSTRPIIFLVGSPITAPLVKGHPGVPDVSGVVDLIQEEFTGTPQAEELRIELAAAENQYQAAFRFLIGRRGQQIANDIIKKSVWLARKPVVGGSKQYTPDGSTPDDTCRSADRDIDGWALSPAVESIGLLLAQYPSKFGRAILTTNFDPLLEVAIERAGDHTFRTMLHRDGNLGQTEGTGCHVIHLHGYWHGADTLHTPRQLTQPRQRLKASLASLIRGKTLVVSGYGGWDDVFTEALMEIVLDDSEYPEIIWTFRSKPPVINKALSEKLSPGVDRGRVNFYAGVDCHTFFPALQKKWLALEPPATLVPRSKVNRILSIVSDRAAISAKSSHKQAGPASSGILAGGDEDRPPLVDFCVGRDEEIAELLTSRERVCFISGLGGQGKSTLAAKYFSEAQKKALFDIYVWRDCKEEAERFETKLISIIERLTGGLVAGEDITNLSVESLADLLLKHAGDRKILFVFDNVDHHVDLEHGRLNASSDGFVVSCLKSETNCRFVFTCRPTINYPNLPVLSRRVGGLSMSATSELFSRRGAFCTIDEIESAHLFTAGHALWLDLLAAQLAKKDAGLKLADLIGKSSISGGAMPEETLQSIWKTLNEREQVVLRALAESVRPATENRLGDYLSERMRFNKFTKALRSLRSLNLIVVKHQLGSSDVVELHPLVRQFIRQRFPRHDRRSFIDDIIKVYLKFLGLHKRDLQQRPGLDILQNWTEIAELDIEAEKYQHAFELLAEVGDVFTGSQYPNEFVRVAKMLFDAVPWSDHPQIKNFDQVLRFYAEIIVDMGRFPEAEEILTRFEETIISKDARYILLCDLRCHAFWVAGKYKESIEWGQRGVDLKARTDVDTRYDSSHHLALAQRDSGDIDPALKTFLSGRNLDEVIDPDELDDDAGGAYYGNIGRCLHLMGQIDPAIICYRKSAVLIEKDMAHEHVVNQGFVRKWIGELLLMRDEPCLAKTFLEAARHKWEAVSPQRADEISHQLVGIEDVTRSCAAVSESDLERFCVAWIYGREDDFEAAKK